MCGRSYTSVLCVTHVLLEYLPNDLTSSGGMGDSWERGHILVSYTCEVRGSTVFCNQMSC